MITKNAKVTETRAGKQLRRRFGGQKVAYQGHAEVETTYHAGTPDEQTGCEIVRTRFFATKIEAASELCQLLSARGCFALATRAKAVDNG